MLYVNVPVANAGESTTSLQHYVWHVE